MLTMRKAGSKRATELASSLSVSAANQSYKSQNGIAVVKVDGSLHKVSIRTKVADNLDLNSFDQYKSEISISSLFLPPGTVVKEKTNQNFNIQNSPEGVVWASEDIAGAEKAKEILIIYTIVFPLDKKNQLTKDAEVNAEDFATPFLAWVEINGKAVSASYAKAGADTHVSIQIMFPHLEKSSESPLNLKFK